MSFVDHLDELRRRLIRFLIVLVVCILAAYAFRKELLDIVRAPVDIPLKKYTSSQLQTDTKTGVPLTSLGAYNCACQEVPSILAPVDDTTPPLAQKAESTAMKTPIADSSSSLVEATSDTNAVTNNLQEQADTWIPVLKSTINDFVMFFQVLLDREPSPIFETEGTSGLPQANLEQYAAVPSMPGQINLNCQCSMAANPPASTQSSMVFIGLPELFFAQMKVAIFAGFFLAFPYMLIEIWGFVGPALYRSEQKVFWIFSVFSYLFFIGGALFGYFVVFPYGFDFFLSLTQLGEIMPSLSVGEYLSFASKLLMAFGFIFEMPLVTFLLARLGIITPQLMIKQARVAILIVFIVSAMLTPPDPFTMILMAGPLILLYILSIGVCFIGLDRQKAALRQQGIEDFD